MSQDQKLSSVDYLNPKQMRDLRIAQDGLPLGAPPPSRMVKRMVRLYMVGVVVVCCFYFNANWERLFAGRVSPLAQAATMIKNLMGAE